MADLKTIIGNKVSDFLLIKELGRGAYGVVNKVKSLKNGITYVIKILDLKLMKERQQKEAWKEAMILKKLNHPNIIKYFTSFIEDGCLHIVMEYAPGGDLYSKIKQLRDKKETLKEDDIWKYTIEILSGVQYLHQNNIIHRDIKCLNLFIGKDNLIKIGDMGVSKLVSNMNVLHCSKVGTPLYLAPELIKQIPYDFKVDMWSIGCSIYHIASLEPPFLGENVISLGNNIVKSAVNFKKISAYSNQLSLIIDKLLSKKADLRPASKEAIAMIPKKYLDEYDLLIKNLSQVNSKNRITSLQNIEEIDNNEYSINTNLNRKMQNSLKEKEEQHKKLASLFNNAALIDDSKIQNTKKERFNIKICAFDLNDKTSIPILVQDKEFQNVRNDEKDQTSKINIEANAQEIKQINLPKAILRPSTAVVGGSNAKNILTNRKINSTNNVNDLDNKPLKIKPQINRPFTALLKEHNFPFFDKRPVSTKQNQNIINININLFNVDLKYLSGINQKLYNKGFDNDNLLYINKEITKSSTNVNKNIKSLMKEIIPESNIRPTTARITKPQVIRENKDLLDIKDKKPKSFQDILKEFDINKRASNAKKITISDFKSNN